MNRRADRALIVAVGASAGGLEAFGELLGQVPAGSGLAFVLVQHLDPTHSSYLTEALGRTTSLPVREIHDGVRPEAGQVYVAPAGAEVGFRGGALSLTPLPSDQRRLHLPIDAFFKALAAEQGDRAIGVVLSGTGADGAQGLRAIKDADGLTLAQDPLTARFRGMPEAAVATGVVDVCRSIAELARELVRISRHPYFTAAPAEAQPGAEAEAPFKEVLAMVRGAAGIDFGEYKPASVRRRVARRMALRSLATLADYVHLLREDPAEIHALTEELLIHVTAFFRDAAAFERLKAEVFPQILRQKREGGTIRIWSAGCSTGEEPYSLLIALLEFLAQQGAPEVPVQLFATDVSEKAIERARAGWYPEVAVRALGPDRVARYFTPLETGGYRISKSVRDRCAFVKHDLAADPPFSRLDLVCCRNVLIYFGPELQKRVLATFHFALGEPGFMLLGQSENVADAQGLFRLFDREGKIFARLPGKSLLRLAPARDSQGFKPSPGPEPRQAGGPDGVRQLESLLLEQYAPPGVVVNPRLEILHFRGRTAPFLEPAPGQPGHDLMRMARKGLVPDLRLALAQAMKDRAPVRRPGVRFERDGAPYVVDLVVVPLGPRGAARDEALGVLFEAPAQVVARPAPTAAVSPPVVEAQQLASLEDELERTRAELKSIVEEHQRTNEELNTGNEELISSNEELQSLNEELQTAKEELQSTNEELSTLNEEMLARNAELNLVNSDLLNVLATVEVPIVIVDGERRIRRFTPRARPLLNLLPTDVGRPIDDIKPNLAVAELDRKIAEVIERVLPHEEEAQGRDGRWYRLQIRPYATVEKKIEGAVLSLIDIDVLRRALTDAEWTGSYAKAVVDAVPLPLVVFDEQLRVVSANGSFGGRYGVASEAVTGRHLHDFMNGVLDTPPLRAPLEALRLRDETFRGVELECEIPRRGRCALSISGCSVRMPKSGPMILLAVEDVSERHRAEAERASLLRTAEAAQASAEDANRTKDEFLAVLSHELRTPLSSLLLGAQRLRRGPFDERRVREAAERIERATKAQAQLIDDLLDISRIVTGKLKMELQSVELAAVIEASVEGVAPLLGEKHLELKVELDRALPPVSGDPLRLQQVVTNLLTNAVKFSEAGGKLSLLVDRLGVGARIRISDAGMGIEPEFLPRLFDRFSQQDSGQTRKYGGLGLGLAIVRHLVEAHGGEVSAESSGRGKGSTFTVLLPLLAAREPRAAPAGTAGPPAAASLDRVRVLVVEDDPGTRETLTEMLALSGAEVRSADSAGRAMQLVESFRPELLVCDIAMPDEDGYSLVRRLRARGPAAGGDTPAVALTAFASQEDRRRALEAGFQKHLAKPVDIDRLVLTLAGLLPGAAPA